MSDIVRFVGDSCSEPRQPMLQSLCHSKTSCVENGADQFLSFFHETSGVESIVVSKCSSYQVSFVNRISLEHPK